MARLSLNVEVKGLEELRIDVEKLSKALPLPSAQLRSLGHYFLAQIKTQTLAGKDAEGAAFKGYSEDYTDVREEAGRSTDPNLFWSGHMSAAMAVTVRPNFLKLYFRTPREGLKAHGHTYGNPRTGLPKRDFFALSKPDLDFAVKFLEGKIVF